MPFQVVRGRSLVMPAGDAASSVLWQCFKATRPQQAMGQRQQQKRGTKRQRGQAVGGSSTRGAQDADAAIFQWFKHLCGKYQGSPNKELVSQKASLLRFSKASGLRAPGGLLFRRGGGSAWSSW